MSEYGDEDRLRRINDNLKVEIKIKRYEILINEYLVKKKRNGNINSFMELMSKSEARTNNLISKLEENTVIS